MSEESKETESVEETTEKVEDSKSVEKPVEEVKVVEKPEVVVEEVKKPEIACPECSSCGEGTVAVVIDEGIVEFYCKVCGRQTK